jgi:hypothetical protein
MILARAAGIPIFVTGGIGGVHRGAEQCKLNKRSLVSFIKPKFYSFRYQC